VNSVEISYQGAEPLPREEKVVFYAGKVINYLGKSNWEVSLVFTTDEFIKELNKIYRNKNEATDVLSFCQENGFPTEADRIFYAGDIVISMEAVRRNAEYFDVDVEEELRRVIVHGILHLSGMDHETNDSFEPMLIKQENILLSLKGERLF